MYAFVNGTKIFYDVDGKQVVWDEEKKCMKEKPVCFILHGRPGGDHYIYGELFHWLSEYMQLIFVDYRGNGRSGRDGDASKYTIKQNVEDLEALRKSLGLDKIVVMGQSYGGIMSQAYATTYPDSVCALILMSAVPTGETFAKASEQLNIRGTPEMKDFFVNVLMAGKIKTPEDARQYLITFAPLYTLYGKERYAEEVDRCILNHELLASPELYSFNFLPVLHKINCPVLLIGGEEDWICTIDQTYQIRERIKDCTTVVIKNSGHEIFLDQPQQTIDVLDRFVREKILPLTHYIKAPMTLHYQSETNQRFEL